MNTSGLSLDQGPNISVPFRFFFTAPIFFLLFALALFFITDDTLLSRFDAQTVGLVHLFTLGVLSMIMIGALFQMLPVLMGVTVGGNKNLVTAIFIIFIIGIVSFSIGLFLQVKSTLLVGTVALFIAFFLFLLHISKDVFLADRRGKSVLLMQFSIAWLWIVLFLGLYLSLVRIGIIDTVFYEQLANVHIVIALFGWTFALIIGVSFTVVPMFYVTPEYTPGCRKTMPYILFTTIVSFIVTNFFFPNLNFISELIASQAVVMYAYQTIKRLKKRRRPIADVTVSYWKSAIFFLLISLLFWWLGYIKELFYTLSFVSFAFGFLGSLLQGMLYKIIPFLVWFHLSATGNFNIPNIKEVIDEEDMWVQFWLYQIFVFLFLISFQITTIKIIAASILVISSLSLLKNFLLGWGVYKSFRS